MPDPVTGLTAGANVIGGIISSDSQRSSANSAAGAQTQAAQMGIMENRRQFDTVRDLLKPYVGTGTSALSQQRALLGLDSPSSVDWEAYVRGNPDALANWNSIKGTSSDKFGGDIAKFGEYHYGADGSRRDLKPFTTAAINGVDAQRAAINALQSSPLFTSLLQQGENAILQNSSATGGLRGGNTQAALLQFRPQLLSQVINDQYSKLGGLSSLGQSSAAGVGSAGMTTGNNISSLLQQQGAAQAGAALARGKAKSDMFGGILGGLGTVIGGGGGGFLGGPF